MTSEGPLALITPTLIKDLREKRHEQRYQEGADRLVEWLPQVLTYDDLLDGLLKGKTRFDIRYQLSQDDPDGPLDLEKLHAHCADRVSQFLGKYIDMQCYDWTFVSDNDRGNQVTRVALAITEVDGWWHFLLRDVNAPAQTKSHVRFLLEKLANGGIIKKDDVKMSSSAITLYVAFHEFKCDFGFDGIVYVNHTDKKLSGGFTLGHMAFRDCDTLTSIYNAIARVWREDCQQK